MSVSHENIFEANQLSMRFEFQPLFQITYGYLYNTKYQIKKNKTLNSYSFLKLGSFNNNESDQKKTTKENTK